MKAKYTKRLDRGTIMVANDDGSVQINFDNGIGTIELTPFQATTLGNGLLRIAKKASQKRKRLYK